MEMIIILVVLALLAFWVARIYNQLVELQNRHENGFSQIEVQLKRRYDLIPNLVEDPVGGRWLFDYFQKKMKDIQWAGAIREDRALRDAAMSGKMISVEEPGAVSSGDIRSIARAILGHGGEETDGEFLQRIDDIIGA